MAEVNNDHGFTMIANRLLEHIFLYPLKKVDLAVIFLTIRYTWGYQKEHSAISVNQLAGRIKTSKADVSRSLKRLICSNIIKVIAEEDSHHPRILELNKDYESWDETYLMKKERRRRAAAAVLRRGELSDSQPSGLAPFQPPELSEEQLSGLAPLQPCIYIKKEEKKIKESNSSSVIVNITYLIGEEEIKNNNTAAVLNELNERLTQLYLSCFSYEPNVYELEAVKKEIFSDDRFEKAEILKIIQESFHKTAIYSPAKRNTNYVIKVIKSIKQELLLKREEEKKRLEKLAASSGKKKEEYIPGSIFSAYEKEMKERKKQLKKKT